VEGKVKKLFIFVFLAFILSACSGTHNVVITYEPNGGTMLKLSETINSDSPQWVPITPQKNNFLFVNWYTDQALTELYTPEALSNKSLILYAKYIEVDQEQFFIVSFVSVGGTFIPNQLIQSGALLIEPTAPVKSGYVFQYWEYVNSISNKQGQVNFSEPITEHLVLEAVYIASTTSPKS
jgi:hypothetical protein